MSEFLVFTLSGITVSWIPLIIGFFITHWKLKKHIDAVTQRQTSQIEKLTEEQTRELLPSRRLRRPGPDV